MANITLDPIPSGFATTTALNSRLEQVEDALNDRVLWRDNGTGEPNSMGNTLDMADNRIINLPDGVDDHEPVTVGQVQTLLDTSPAIDVIRDRLDAEEAVTASLGESAFQDNATDAETIAGIRDDVTVTPAGLFEALTDWNLTVGAGDVVGPAISSDNQLALFDGVTGNLLKTGQTIPEILSDRVKSVATIADLRSLTGVIIGQQFSLVEHTSGTGQGGGTFTAVAGIAGDDNGIVIVTANGVRVRRDIVDYVTPQMFGAVGSGTETAAVQACMDSGYPIWFDRVFTCGTLTMTRDIAMISMVYGGLKKSASLNAFLINNTSPEENNYTIFANGISIDGSSESNTPGTGFSDIRLIKDGDNGLESRCVFYNCKFTGPTQHSVYALSRGAGGKGMHVIFDTCAFSGGALQTASYGVEYLSFSTLARAVVTNCEFDYGASVSSPNSPPVAISFTHRSSDVAYNVLGTISITNCRFKRVGRSQSNALGAVSLYAGPDNVTVSDCKFIECYGQALEIKSHSKNLNISNITIDNVIGHSFTASGFSFEGSNVDNGGGLYYVQGRMTINNIIVANVQGNGFLMESGSLASSTQAFRNVSISNVIIENCTGMGFSSSAIRDCQASNIRIRDVDGVAFRLDEVYGDWLLSNINAVSDADAAIVAATSTTANVQLTNSRFTTNSATRCGELYGVASLKLSDCYFSGASVTDLRIGSHSSYSSVHDVQGSKIALVGSTANLDLRKVNTARTSPTTLIISSGEVSVFEDIHFIDTEGAAATDDLDTISGGYLGRTVTFRTSNSAKDVTFKHATGNIRIGSGADFTLSTAVQHITLTYDGANWLG